MADLIAGIQLSHLNSQRRQLFGI